MTRDERHVIMDTSSNKGDDFLNIWDVEQARRVLVASRGLDQMTLAFTELQKEMEEKSTTSMKYLITNENVLPEDISKLITDGFANVKAKALLLGEGLRVEPIDVTQRDEDFMLQMERVKEELFRAINSFDNRKIGTTPFIGVDLARDEDITVKCYENMGTYYIEECTKRALELKHQEEEEQFRKEYAKQWQESQPKVFEFMALRHLGNAPMKLEDAINNVCGEKDIVEEEFTPRNRKERRAKKSLEDNNVMWKADVVPRRTTKTVKKKQHRR